MHTRLVEGRQMAIVPMGHLCATAGFLNQQEWRYQALPLDWSCATFKVWYHMLRVDDPPFSTLLRQSSSVDASSPHPYNSMFPDVEMFLHQGGWAGAAVRRRVGRLCRILLQGRAFGLAFFFEGKVATAADDGNSEGATARASAAAARPAQDADVASLDVVMEDARRLVRSEPGIHHIAIVWFQSPRSDGRLEGTEHAEWLEPGDCVSVLRYTRHGSPVLISCQGLIPEVGTRVARLLQERFPGIFPPVDCSDLFRPHVYTDRTSENGLSVGSEYVAGHAFPCMSTPTLVVEGSDEEDVSMRWARQPRRFRIRTG